MTITFRNYTGQEDYWRISQFLIRHYQENNADGNFIEPAWEYMHYHPMIDSSALGKIGIWEEAGEIVGVAHYESELGEAFFELHPAYLHLRAEMLEYAGQNLSGVDKENGRKFLNAYINDYDVDFQKLAQACGYQKSADGTRPMYLFEIPDPFPAITLPEGFSLKSLADECDWAKVNRVLWRGFNHPGDPPGGEEEYESRRKMFDTPKAQRDLKIVVAAPNGEFVAFCGMFYEAAGRFAYVEPVATDPDYRRMGLGKAAVLEGIRRCRELGATVAYVGSQQQFYQAIGFRKAYLSECWVKEWGQEIAA